MKPNRAWLSWATVGLLAVLCGVLALLQNRWIGEVSHAERERLQRQLQAELNRLARDFDDEIANSSVALLPDPRDIQLWGREKAWSARYADWKTSHDSAIFSRISVARPNGDSLELWNLDPQTARLSPAGWPSEWNAMRDMLAQTLREGPFHRPPPATAVLPSTLIAVPRFSAPDEIPGREIAGRGRPPGAVQEWLLVELNVSHLRDVVFPNLLLRYLGSEGKIDYDAAVIAPGGPSEVIFETSAGIRHAIRAPDASIPLLRLNFAEGIVFHARAGRHIGLGRALDLGRRSVRAFTAPPPGPPLGPGVVPGAPPGPEMSPGLGPGPGPGPGRWRLVVRHHAGSIEAVVARARLQNLATSLGLLALILATVAALVRYSRRAQRLAELQMNFVAGVSHELRTPLTVIRTAAFNLRGKLASRPEQVERYGTLIQQQAERLGALVEQVLQFASDRAGHPIRAREPAAVETLIEGGLRSGGADLAAAGVTIEKHIDPDLPPVLVDELAVEFALQNLIDNAIKYGGNGPHSEHQTWIGIFASLVEGGAAVEIRIADRGPGIPPDELEHVFDPFFRGRRAVQDQVHGTGLGLSLVKNIVEAHGGTIRASSDPGRGTEFVVLLPITQTEPQQHEFANTVG